uniref:Uncharacterized protein n=1 Tax=Sus scrofa TaxID=9823 RepID=A0A480E097_PIG
MNRTLLFFLALEVHFFLWAAKILTQNCLALRRAAKSILIHIPLIFKL